MLVCHCMNITDSQIIEKVRSGLDTVDDLARECGITMGCGGCYSLVEKIVKEENKRMSKTVRVLKLVSEYVSSPDGTGGYEMPKDWRPITVEELALTRFNTESPEFMEKRQFIWDKDTPPYGKKRIDATLYWYGDKTGIAFHKEWVYNPTQKQGKWELFYFAFGCDHKFKELSQEESRSRGIEHYGNCWHVHECQNCKFINSYDSSD